MVYESFASVDDIKQSSRLNSSFCFVWKSLFFCVIICVRLFFVSSVSFTNRQRLFAGVGSRLLQVVDSFVLLLNGLNGYHIHTIHLPVTTDNNYFLSYKTFWWTYILYTKFIIPATEINHFMFSIGKEKRKEKFLSRNLKLKHKDEKSSSFTKIHNFPKNDYCSILVHN